MRTAVFAAAILAGSCQHPAPSPEPLAHPVLLVVAIDKTRFASDVTLDVRIWSAEQLRILETSSHCAAARDAQTGATRFVCPDDADYRVVTPERFEAPAASFTAQLEIKSTTIRVGDRFRVRVSGLYRDHCNTTSADTVLDALSQRILVDRLDWETTARACGKGVSS